MILESGGCELKYKNKMNKSSRFEEIQSIKVDWKRD